MSIDKDFRHSQEIYLIITQKNLSNAATKTGLDVTKTASKIVVLKTAEATAELMGNKISEKLWNQNLTWWEFKRCWRNSYSAWQKARNIKRIKAKYYKMELYKISKLLNDSTVLKFVSRKWIEVNDLSNGQYLVNKNYKV